MRDISPESHFRSQNPGSTRYVFLQWIFLEEERSPQTTCFSGASTSEIMSHLDHSYSSAVSFKQASAVRNPTAPTGETDKRGKDEVMMVPRATEDVNGQM